MTQSEIFDLSEQLNEDVVLAMNALDEGSGEGDGEGEDEGEGEGDGDEGD